MDLLCAMWWSGTRGVLTGSEEDMCRFGRCSVSEWRQFVELNARQSFCNLTEANKILTVTNRRMVREERARESARSRSKRFYNAHSNAGLTRASPSTPSTSSTSTKEEQSIVAQAPLRTVGNGRLEDAKAVLAWLNEKSGKHFRMIDTNLDLIMARLNSGIPSGQLRAIVTRKIRQWKGTDQEEYIRPATLFNKTKCEQYLGELPSLGNCHEEDL